MAGDDSKKAKTAEQVLGEILGAKDTDNALLRQVSGAEQYRELLRRSEASPNALLAGVTSWKAPTEEEFNSHWFLPDEVLLEQPHRIEGIAEKRAIAEELKAGVVIAVARNAEIRGQLSRFVRVPSGAWKSATDSEVDHFWERRQLIVTEGGTTGYGDGITNRYLDIKFDPKSLSGRPQPAETEAEPAPILPPDPHVGEAEYETWLTPSFVLKRLEGHLNSEDARREIYRRLEHGELLSAARTATWFQTNGLFEIGDYGRLGAFLWAVNECPEEGDLIWKTGTHTLMRPDWPHSETRYKVECFGIRFDPEGVVRLLGDCGVAEAETRQKASHTAAKPLPAAEAQRVSKLILEIWGKQVTETRAVQLAQIISPEHKVSRDPFLREFRAIRGYKKRGKQPLNGE